MSDTDKGLDFEGARRALAGKTYSATDDYFGDLRDLLNAKHLAALEGVRTENERLREVVREGDALRDRLMGHSWSSKAVMQEVLNVMEAE